MLKKESTSRLLTDKVYKLKKFPGKGGWTFAEIPEIPADKHAHFGWVIVKGSIDSYLFSRYHLASMGNGNLFFPVKASVRKMIQKEAGDLVRITLYEDDSAVEVPAELQECLQSEPIAHSRFISLPENEKAGYIKWIYAVKKEDKRAERIVKLIEKMLK